MNFFLDFDHTLYNTPLLTNEMLSSLSKYICKSSNENYEDIFSILKQKFQRGKDNIYDIYSLINYFADIYNYDKYQATNIINDIIFNGEKFLFYDSISFLQYLKEHHHKIYILSYNESELYFQTLKIAGSGVLKYADCLTTTLVLKGDIPLDFSQCIFVDDKPKDLISISHKKPFKIYRIRRKNDTYSNEEIKFSKNNPIQEFPCLEDLKIQIDKDLI